MASHPDQVTHHTRPRMTHHTRPCMISYPVLQVEVPCTMTIDEGFTAYILKCRTPNGRVWATARRFSEFDELRVVLVRMRA